MALPRADIRQERRSNQTAKEKPVAQYYGGSEDQSDIYAARDWDGIDAGEAGIDHGLEALWDQVANAQNANVGLIGDIGAEKDSYRQDVDRLANQEAAGLQAQQLGLAANYGGMADASLGNFAAGRSGVQNAQGQLAGNNFFGDYEGTRGLAQGAAGQLAGNNFFGDYEGTRGGVTNAQGTLTNNNFLGGFESGTGAILGDAGLLEGGNFTGDYDATKGQVLGSAADIRNTDYMNQYQQSRGAIAGTANALEQNNWDANFQAGRGDILSGAGKLEQFADQSEGNYQSSADLAFNAAQAQNQRNALGMAAGRGANAVRTAIATANAGTQAAGLDQQVVKAQEHNAIQQQKADAIKAASGIRTGLSAQDQQQEAMRTQQNALAGQLRTGISSMDQTAGQTNLARDTTALNAQQNIAQADLQKANLQQQQIAQAAQVRLGLSGQQLQSAQLQSNNTIAAGQLGLGLGQNDLAAANQRANNIATSGQLGLGLGQNDLAASAQRANNIATSGQLGLGLGAQDLGAAELGANRQQAAQQNAQGLLGLRGDSLTSNANFQLGATGLQGQLGSSNAELGYGAASQELGIGQDTRSTYLNAEQAQRSAELGIAGMTEAQRQEWAKNNSAAAKFNRGVGIATLGILGEQLTMGFNLGDYSGQLSLNDRNRAAQRVGSTMQQQPANGAVRQAAASNSLGSLGTNAVARNPYSEPQAQASNGWGQTQQYLGTLGSLQSGNSGGKKNGLQKVLGLVGLFA